MKIDIQEIINNKLAQMEEQKTIEKAIEEGIENTILKSISEALTGWDLRRQIEEKMSKEVSRVVSDIGFTAYNSFIAEKVKMITEEVCKKDIADKIQNTFDGIFVNKRDSIKLSEICEMYREWICNKVDEHEKYDLERFYVEFEQREPPYDWITIKFAKEKPERYSSSSFNDEIEFTVHRSYEDKTKGSLGSVRIDGYGIDDKLNFGDMSDVELLLVNMSYNKTPIEIDIEDEDDIDDSFDVDI